MAQTVERRIEYRQIKRAEASFLASQQKVGKPKKGGRPSKAAVIEQALRDNSTTFFKKVLDDETEEKLWWLFIQGRVPEVSKDGEAILDKNGLPTYREISGVSWNAFRQMVAYKRGMPAMAKEEENPNAGKITVNFNVMGASHKQMEQQIKEIEMQSSKLGILPEFTPEKV